MKSDELLIRNTIRIETKFQNGYGSGTGFFYEFSFNNNFVPVIVTNKHVISGASSGSLFFSVCDNNGIIVPNKMHRVDITDFSKAWIMHPNKDIDLCIMPIAPIISELSSQGIKVVYSVLTRDNIPSTDVINNLSSIEDVTIVGYPDGIWDSTNNLPVVRKGITATPLKYNFEGYPKFLVDSAIFPGSSGSPVFIYNQGSYHIGNTLYVGDRLLFIGIIYAVTLHDIEGKIEFVDVPAVNTPLAFSKMPNNLGVAIKSEELYEFVNILNEKLNAQAESNEVQ